MNVNFFAWSFRNASWTFSHQSPPFLERPSFLEREIFSSLWSLTRHDIRAAIFIFCRIEVFIARVEVFLPSSLNQNAPIYSPRDSGSQLPSFFFCNQFNSVQKSPRTSSRSSSERFSMDKSNFFLSNICVAKFRSILFTTASSYQAFFRFVVNGKPEFIQSNATDTIKI